MATLVNDLQFTLSNPCPTGFLQSQCRDQDYRSWRKVAVGLRSTLLGMNLAGVPISFQKRIQGWLLSWLDKDSGIKSYPVRYGILLERALKQPDPSLEFTKKLLGVPAPFNSSAAKFPEDPPISFNLQTAYNYTPITKELLSYIREGWDIVQEAEDEGWLDSKSSEIERAEERTPQRRWIPLIVGGVGIAGGLGLLLYALANLLPALTKVKRR